MERKRMGVEKEKEGDEGRTSAEAAKQSTEWGRAAAGRGGGREEEEGSVREAAAGVPQQPGPYPAGWEPLPAGPPSCPQHGRGAGTRQRDPVALPTSPARQRGQRPHSVLLGSLPP